MPYFVVLVIAAMVFIFFMVKTETETVIHCPSNGTPAGFDTLTDGKRVVLYRNVKCRKWSSGDIYCD